MEHDLPVGQYGIKVFELGPWQYGEVGGRSEVGEDGNEKGGAGREGKWQYSYLPVLTDQCNLCAQRLAKGKLPTCVKHCQSQCLKFGTPEEVAEELESKRKQLFITV
jgi:anaerobic dimethyl sulfoxide reductase subunit B (iron-sulfur subunit)